MTASEMGRRRAQKLTPQRRREIARSGGLKSRANARQAAIQRRTWSNILTAVETLFARIKADGKPRALIYHMGEILVMATDSQDYKMLVAKHSSALVGVYNHRSTRQQVFDDINESANLPKFNGKRG